VQTLKAFSADLELSVRRAAKGYGSRPVELADLRKWLDDALASNTDEPMRPREGTSSQPHLTASNNRFTLGKLLERVKARVTELESGKAEPKESVKTWLVTQLGDVSTGRVSVADAKSGSVRQASSEEIKSWLAASSVKD
jgi:hypothetical protein